MIVCPAPGVRAIALSQSLPTPKTHELARVVTRLALGAPDDALPEDTAPIAPEPLVPLISTPLKLTTEIEAATLCERAAFTLTLGRVDVARARQISRVPFCWFAKVTKPRE